MGKTICIFSALYYPNIGGAEVYTDHLAEALVLQGHRVFIVTSNVFDLPERERLANGADIVRLPCFNLVGGRYPFPRKNRSYRKLIDDLVAEPADYVVVNTRFYGHTLEGLRFARRKGVSPVVIDHGSAHLTFGSPVLDPVVEWYEHGITAMVKRLSPAFYGVSQKSCAWLEHFAIQPQGVLNNSIDASSFRANASARDFREELGLSATDTIVAFTGRFVPEKGIRVLSEVAALLEDRMDIWFLFAGDGPLRKELEDNHPNIKVLGRLAPPDVSALLRASDLFCLPSRSEGFSTSLLECAAWGVVPIVSDVGGARELVPTEEYGVVLDAVDARDIADKIVRLSSHREEVKRMGGALQQRVERDFSWDATARKVLQACKGANDNPCSME